MKTDENKSLPPARLTFPREPLFYTAIAVGAGILLSRAAGLGVGVWLVGTALLLAGTAFVRQSALSAALVYLAWAGLGAARWEVSRGEWPADEIAQVLQDSQPMPVRLQGRIHSMPEIRPPDRTAPAWAQLARTRFEFLPHTLVSGSEEHPCSGKVLVSVTGHLLNCEPGDEVDIVGRLSLPSPPANPGDFDYRESLARQGIRSLLTVDHPEAVRPVSGPPAWEYGLARARARLRTACLERMNADLPRDIRPLAASLLLGDRSDLDEELETEFIESGTMHILAISGQHVAILIGLVWGVLRLLDLSLRTTVLALLTVVALYALMTDQRPPVMRATLLTFFIVAGLPWGRIATGMNALGASAIVLLLSNPNHLYDTGAQLSFLAVAAIVLVTRLLSLRSEHDGPDLRPERPVWIEGLRKAGEVVWKGYLVTGLVWVFTLPLQMSVFHIAAPVGFLVNVLLTPLVVSVLATGYLYLLLAIISPVLAIPAAQVLSGLLILFHKIVAGAASASLGHFEVGGPSVGWCAVYYLLLLLLILSRHSRSRWRCVTALVIWGIGGFSLEMLTPSSKDLRLTVLSVGHGQAVVIEFPGGNTLVYDAGALGGGRRTAQSLRNTIWRNGHRAINTLLLSHADTDHFNAVPQLIKSLPVGNVLISQEFPDFRQPDVLALCEDVTKAGIPLRMVMSGDTIECGTEVGCRILHPPAGFGDALDNANSIVVEIESFGRRILLTGDLERNGLQALLASPSRRCDLLLAPHHGSRSANTPDLARWAAPRNVIASCRRGAPVEALRHLYADAEHLFATGSDGCITVTISPSGDMTFQAHLVESLRE